MDATQGHKPQATNFKQNWKLLVLRIQALAMSHFGPYEKILGSDLIGSGLPLRRHPYVN